MSNLHESGHIFHPVFLFDHHSIQMSNAAFHSRVGRWPLAVGFLISIGFREGGGNLFLLPAFEKPPHQMTRIVSWFDHRIPDAEKAARAYLKHQVSGDLFLFQVAR